VTDNLKKRGPADRARINVNEPHEVRYWTKALKVSEERLCELVAKAGVMAADVRKLLGDGGCD
jgi:hypothetical protein